MEIKLLKLVMHNFQHYEKKEVSFDKQTVISGQNATGKTTVANAYNWLLFNCDYDLKDNPDIRRRVNGVPVDGNVVVEGLFDVDGHITHIVKVQKRRYSKDGTTYTDTNSYVVDDIPKSQKEFAESIGVDLSTLKFCSNPNAFISKKANDIREFLFSTVKDISDVEIAKSNESLNGLVFELDKCSTADLIAKHRALKTKYSNELPKIDGMIEENEHIISMKNADNVDDLETKHDYYAGKLKEQKDELFSLEKKGKDLMELKFKLNDIVNNANSDLVKKKNEIRNKIGELTHRKSGLKSLLSQYSDIIEKSINLINSYASENGELETEYEKLLEMKFDNSKAFCELCGQELSSDEVEKLVENFNKNKEEKLNDLQNEIKICNANIARLTEVKKTNSEKIDNVADEISKIDTDISKLEKELGSLPDEVDMEEEENIDYFNVQKEIEEQEELQKKINESRQRISELESVIRECFDKLQKCDKSVEEERIKELKKDKLFTHQKIADSERILDLLDELTKVKNDSFSKKINDNFGRVKWKLFETTKGGQYKSVCIPEVDGMSILSTLSNRANVILGEIDICNSIQKIKGISCPIWIDNAECLDGNNRKNAMDMIDGQSVFIFVSDK